MKKKALCFILSLILTITLLPAAGLAADRVTCEINGVKIYFDKSTGIIEGLAGDYYGNMGDVVIPSEIDGTAVKGIARYAFFNGYYQQAEIQSLVLPEGIESVGDGAFGGQNKMNTLVLPASLTNLGSRAFVGSGLSAPVFPAGIKVIPEALYAWSRTLASATIPDGVETIGPGAFAGCKALEYVEIPVSVTSIGSYAFGYAGNEEDYITYGSYEYLADYYMVYGIMGCESLSDVYYAGSREQWESISIAIGNEALLNADVHFYSTHDSVNDADTVKFAVTGGNVTFDPQSGLITDADATVTEADIPAYINETAVTGIAGSAFSECTLLERVSLPEGVLSIGRNAFYNCTKLGKTALPESLESIGDYAFSGCASLVCIHLPAAAVNLSDYAFYGFNGLKYINIPEGVSRIGKNMFSGCAALSAVYIPKSMTQIENSSFLKAQKLSDVFYGGTQAEWTAASLNVGKTVSMHFAISDDSAFLFDENGYLYFDKGTGTLLASDNMITRADVPDEIDGASVTAVADKAFFERKELKYASLPDSVVSIGSNAFNGCKRLGTLNLPASLIDMGEGTFSKCSALKEITVPDGVKYLEENVFSECTSLKSVSLPAGLKEIGSEAFYGCTSLETADLPDTVETIGYEAFRYCKMLSAVTVPSGVKSVSEYAFSGCTSLSSASLEDGVVSVGEYAFSSCTSLSELTLPESLKDIGTAAFSGCTSLTAAGMEEGLTSIGQSAFSGCTSLVSADIPDTVRSMGTGAFSGCSSLVSADLPEGIAAVEKNTFKDCVSLKTVSIPVRVRTIDEYAFYGCVKLADVNYGGSSDEWDSVVVKSNNTPLLLANMHFEEEEPAQPMPVNITSLVYENGAVSMTWEPQDGVDGFRVYRKTGTGKWTTVLSSTTAASFTDNDVKAGVTYTYTVRSYVGNNFSTDYAATAMSIKTVNTTEPLPVTITSLVYENGAVSLEWQAQDGVDGYRVYRKTGSGKWTTVLSSTTDTSFTDNDVREGATYAYTVRSFVGSKYSTDYAATAKSVITVVPIEPLPVTITSLTQSGDSVILLWDAQEGADGYRVYRKTGTGKWTTVLYDTTGTSFIDTNVTAGKTYTYTVRSHVGSKYSAGYNDTAKVIKVVSTAKPVPVTISKLTQSGGAVVLMWDAADGVDGYRVYRKTGTGKWVTVLSSTTGTSFVDTNVTAGKTYTYTVRSFVGSEYSTDYADTAQSIKVTAD